MTKKLDLSKVAIATGGDVVAGISKIETNVIDSKLGDVLKLELSKQTKFDKSTISYVDWDDCGLDTRGQLALHGICSIKSGLTYGKEGVDFFTIMLDGFDLYMIAGISHNIDKDIPSKMTTTLKRIDFNDITKHVNSWLVKIAKGCKKISK